MYQMSLVDCLAYELGLDYLSDLHFPDKISAEKLRYLLEKRILAEDFPEKDWLDACEYICGKHSDTKEEAKQQMLEFTSKLVV